MKHNNYLHKNRIIVPFIFLLMIFVFIITPLSAQVGINNSNPDASAALDITSTDKGLLIPRISDHTSIVSPATGLLVYDSITNSFWYYNGSDWTEIIATSPSGDLIIDGLIGINESTPLALLHVTKDQDATTSIRLDNTNQGVDVLSTAIEFWDGSNQEAFIGYNNTSDFLIISNNFSANTNIVIDARDDVILNNEGLTAMTIKQVNSNPGTVNIASLSGTDDGYVRVNASGDLFRTATAPVGPTDNQEIIDLKKENQELRKRLEKLESMMKELLNSE